MIQFLADAQQLIKKLKSYKLTQISREQNSQADALETNCRMSIRLLVLQWPATLEEPKSKEISAIEEDETLMTPLVWFQENDILPKYCKEA